MNSSPSLRKCDMVYGRKRNTTTAIADGVDCPLCRRVVPPGEEEGRCYLGHALPEDPLDGPFEQELATTGSTDPYAGLRDGDLLPTPVDLYAELRDGLGDTGPGSDLTARLPSLELPADWAAPEEVVAPDDPTAEVSPFALLARGQSPFDLLAATDVALAPAAPAPLEVLRLPAPPDLPTSHHDLGHHPYAHPLDGLLGLDEYPFPPPSGVARPAGGTATAVLERPAAAPAQPLVVVAPAPIPAAVTSPAAPAHAALPDAPGAGDQAGDPSAGAPDPETAAREAAEDARYARRRLLALVGGGIAAAGAVTGAAAAWFLI